MKILLAGPVPPHPGGGAIGRAELAAGFARAGHEVCIVAPITETARDAGERFASAHPELRIERYVLRQFEPMPFRPPEPEFLREEAGLVVPLVTSLIARSRPDVVVVGRESFARYVPEVARAHGLPSVLLVRGSPTGHILAGRFPPEDAERLLGEFRKVDLIIAVAVHLADGLRGLGFGAVHQIPNAIDTRRFAPGPGRRGVLDALGVDPAATVVLVPANLHPRKRPADVVASAAIACRRAPGLVYLFAGTGVQRDEIEGLCRERGLEGRARFLGWRPYEEMPALMNAADVVVMASESEGMARAYLEAMACERLLLASDIPASRELIRDGHNGLLFRMGDVDHLAARTLEAAGDPELRRSLGRRARATVARVSVEAVVPRYLRALSGVVAARGMGARGTPGRARRG